MAEIDIARHELWRAKYRARRYLAHLNKDELDSRFSDILTNITVLSGNNQTGILPVDSNGEAWMIRMTHCFEEYCIRLGPYPAGLPPGVGGQEGVPRPSLGGQRAGQLLKDRIPVGGFVVRYSKASFIRQAFGSGRLRFGPASQYADASLNYAVRDDELLIEIAPDPNS